MEKNASNNRPGEIGTAVDVFIVGPQSIFRNGLKETISWYPEIKVTGESPASPDCLARIEELQPDIVLVDIGAPAWGGMGITRRIATGFPSVAVIVLSPRLDDEELFQAIKSGAVAYQSKDTPPDEVVATLKQVAMGEYPINESLLKRPDTARKMLRLFRRFAINGMGPLMTPLSSREVEILKQVAEGSPNKRIADALNTSEQTIKNHITSIMRKLNANDRTHAVVLALRQGWLSIEEVTVLEAEPDGAH